MDPSAPVIGSAVARRDRRISIVWIIPVLAVAIGAWLAWSTWSKQGPVITIAFESGEGLQAGQSLLKFKDITFGTVQGLELTPNHQGVLVKVQTTSAAEPLLTEGAIFWVVKPRLFAGNVSGLDTLLSGSYVGMLPGGIGAPARRTFVGRENPPVLDANVPGRTFLLKANRLGSLSLGSPVFFRDLQVGEVLGWDLENMAESVTIHAFVRAPYDQYVKDETRFWNASGLAFNFGGGGLKIELESVKALLLGGIAFDSPVLDRSGAVSTVSAADHPFPLFADRTTANNASYSRRVRLIAYFADSVRGISAGSDVTIHGLTVGRVLDVRLMYDAAAHKILAPVRFEVEPERVLGIGSKKVFPTDAAAVDAMLKAGFRVGLQSVSLLTGEQALALELVRDAPPAEVAMEGDAFVLPTTASGGFAGLEAGAATLLNHVNEIPFAQIGQNLAGILRSLDSATQGPELKQAVAELTSTLTAVQDLARKLDAGVGPAAKQLPEVTAQLGRTLANADKLVQSVDNAYGDNTKFSRDLERTMAQLNDALRSVRALADLLTRHPEALIKGRPAGGLE